MNNKVILGIIVLVIVVLSGYFAVKAMKNTPVPIPTPVVEQQTSQPTTPTASPTASVMQEITVEGNEFAFIPSTITVKQGEAVKVTFKNTGKYPHNFTLTDLSIQTKTIQSGEEDTVTFTPDKTGSFTYVCTVPTHADKGMKGTLTVQ